MLIIKHRWHNLTKTFDQTAVDGAEIDIRICNSELIVQHDPFKSGQSLEYWLNNFDRDFLIANVKEEGLEPRLLPMLAGSNVRDYFILDESVPFIIKHCKEGNSNFGIRVSKWEPAAAAIKIMQEVNPSPTWVWLDTFDAQLPVNQEELVGLIECGARICLVSPELHIDYPVEYPTEVFIRSVDTIGMEKFHAVCTKQPAFWNNIKQRRLLTDP